MDYIKTVRAQMGNDPLILVASAVLVTNAAGKVLLQHRGDTKDWGIPGGFLELGESTEEAAIRELFEETGLRVQNLKLADVFSGDGYYYVYPNGDKVHNVIILYTTNEYTGSLAISDYHEVLDLKFFDPIDLPNRLIPTSKKMLQAYFSKIGANSSINQ